MPVPNLWPSRQPGFNRIASRVLYSALLLVLGACGGGSSSGSSAEPTATPASPPPVNSPPPQLIPPPPNPGTQVKVLALYTDGVAERYPDPALRIEHLFNVANQVLQTSGVNLDLSLTHLQSVDYPNDGAMENALDDLTFGRDPALADVATLRDDYQADLVTLFRPYNNDGRCGLAWVTGFGTDGDFANAARYGFSVVAANCSDYTLVHELGHNLGLAHSRRENPQGGSLEYGVGYGVQDEFVTIMASPSAFAAPRLPRLSNPAQQCEDRPCGVPIDNPNDGADAVAAINASKEQIAQFR